MPKVVILAVIDCLRADHVSAYGYPRATTPTIDALAEKGVLWENACSTSSWTKPSAASYLTGLYPSQHGAFEGIKRSKGRLTSTDVVRCERPTLAERFVQHGWRCGAFINNAQLGQFTGLDRGFECYEPESGKADRLLKGFSTWLDREPQRPAFAYLHFLEAHWPYKPRRRHVRMFGGDRDTNQFRDYSARDYGRLRRSISRGEQTLRPDQLEHMIQMYDGAIRRVDGKIKLLLQMLAERDLREQTALFVTADHGDEFLEHGKIGHGHALYDELTHVPLIASLPNAAAGVRHAEPVSLVDLPDTLLAVAGANDADHNLLEPGARTRPAIAELRVRRRYTQSLRAGDWKLHRRFTFDADAPSYDGRRPPHELVRTAPHKVEVELYDVQADPGEQRDLAAAPGRRAVRERLTAELDEWWQRTQCTQAGGPAGEVELDDVVVQRLRALGYVE